MNEYNCNIPVVPACGIEYVEIYVACKSIFHFIWIELKSFTQQQIQVIFQNTSIKSIHVFY